MSISFNEIPSNVRVPFVFVEFDNTGAATAPGSNPYNALMIGQRLAAGTIAAEVPTLVTSLDQGKRYFGVGSQLALMLDTWFRNNKKTKLTVIALDDAQAGVMATKTLTITGPATAAGTLYLYIGGKLVSVAVTSTMTATALATAVAAAVQADTSLPFTAASDAGVVTLTCKWKGETGSAIDVRTNYYSGEATPAGIAVAIAAGTAGRDHLVGGGHPLVRRPGEHRPPRAAHGHARIVSTQMRDDVVEAPYAQRFQVSPDRRGVSEPAE